MKKSVLLYSPSLNAQRGNTVTALRLKAGMEQRGWTVKTASDPDLSALSPHDFSLVHALNGEKSSAHFLRPEWSRIPLLLTLTGTDINSTEPSVCRKTADMIRHAGKVSVFHRDFLERAVSLVPESMSKISVVPQGIFLEDGILSPEPVLPEGKFLFILPCGIRPEKNNLEAMRAAVRAASVCEKIHLISAGPVLDPLYGEKVSAFIEQHFCITGIGEIPHSSMKALFGRCHAVLNTSLSEGQPQASLEAMSCGLPGIFSDVPGNRGIAEHGVNGFYYKKEEELAELMIFLAENPDRARSAGLAGKALAEEKYSFKRETDSYDLLYRSLLDIQ